MKLRFISEKSKKADHLRLSARQQCLDIQAKHVGDAILRRKAAGIQAKDRSVLGLFLGWNDTPMSIEAIASMLNIPPNVAMERIRRSMVKIR